MSENLFLASCIVAFLTLFLPLLFLASARLGPRSETKNKHMLYESGISSPIGTSEGRMSAKFYLIAILFVLFDVEIIFMFPWALNLRELGFLGLFEMLTFILLLAAGVWYVYRIKALSWQ